MSVRLYRITAIVLLLFAAGHTYGFLNFRAANVEGRAVWDAMNHVPLPVGASTFTYGGFYTAFGLDISLYIAFSAYLAWYLGTLVRRAPQVVLPLSTAFVLLQVGGAVLSWVYFGPVQVISGALVTILLAWATVTLPKTQD